MYEQTEKKKWGKQERVKYRSKEREGRNKK